jgi:SNF2 family DNA or RNA helicase
LDLGTGKTIVSLHAIEKLREEGKVKCALLIMSSSLTKQWEKRIQEFTDCSVVLLDGSISKKKRSIILEELMENPPQYLLFGIRQVITEFSFIKKINPELVLVDEVTSIKNFGSQQSKTIKRLISTYRIGLTAEPIENGKAEELFSIFQWIDKDLFGKWQDFDNNYIIRNPYTNFPTGHKNMHELHDVLMTACVSKRRTDPDVAQFMPTVEEYNCYIEMDDDTYVCYQAIVRDLLRVLYELGPRAAQELSGYYSGVQSSDSESGTGQVGSRLISASLLLDHPAILRASGRLYNDSERAGGSQYASDLCEAGRAPAEGVRGAKFEACLELAQEYLDADPEHKVIIFAKYKGVLPLLAEGLDKYGSVLFTGDLNGKQRGEAIERFTNAPDTRLFLSSDAGGYGVDLWCASHLINYDLPDSAGTFKQRNGRHVRASSKFRKVFIDNLIVTDSIEEYQLGRLKYKSDVARAALTGQMSDASGKVESEAKSLTKFLEDYLKDKT